MPRSGSVLDRAGAGVHLQLAGNGCDAIHVAEGAIHGQLLVQVLATAAVGFHGSNSNDVDTVMLARANALVGDNGYESPIDLLNSCDADESDEKAFESDPVSPARTSSINSVSAVRRPPLRLAYQALDLTACSDQDGYHRHDRVKEWRWLGRKVQRLTSVRLLPHLHHDQPSLVG